MSLKENYQDDILDVSKNTRRRYRMITNSDGTVSFEDVTAYSQTGSTFAAADINAVNKEVNKISSMVNGNSFRILETSLTEYVDKNTWKKDIYVGTEWNGTHAFANQLTANGNTENVNHITVSPLVMNGQITVYAHSDGAFDASRPISGVCVLLVGKQIDIPYIPPTY